MAKKKIAESSAKNLNKKSDSSSNSNKTSEKTQLKSASTLASEFNSSSKYETTADIKFDKDSLIGQVIGQDDAVNIMKKAAAQRRHVLLIGEPGTGKSMLGVALAQLLPKEKLVDIVSFPNPNDENMPLIRTMKAGTARDLVYRAKVESANMFKGQNFIFFALMIMAMIAPWWALNYYQKQYGYAAAAIIFTALFLGGMIFLGSFIIFMNLNKKMNNKVMYPKTIVDNFGQKNAPFYDATGAHAGALLGDVLHDPFQSGGLGTPAHERVVAGMIHKANMGVLFVDEIATLHPQSQQELLTAIQEGKFAITGQSERSAGAMVRTEPVPCNFILIAAGNIETVKDLHPALRSRIKGYGYEIFMNNTMIDTPDNRAKLAKFVAQEVEKDKKIPHFTKIAVEKIIEEARRMANRKNHLTLKLRELGGLVRAAGDIAIGENAKLVDIEHVIKAKKLARSLEHQITDKMTEYKKEYEVIITKGNKVGRVNGMAVIGYSGMVLPIEAEVTPGGKEAEIIATGKLGEIAKESVKNVSAVIKNYFGEDLKNTKDVYVQFLQSYEGVEGDSASIAIAVAIISALKNVPVRQDYAITGSLTVRGDVLPIGGVSYKIEAAIEAGIPNVIVPKSNMKDIVVDKEKLKLINIIPVERIDEVLRTIFYLNPTEKKMFESILKKSH